MLSGDAQKLESFWDPRKTTVFLRVLEIFGRNPFTGSTDDFYHVWQLMDSEGYKFASLFYNRVSTIGLFLGAVAVS